jgi:hypothetical protein
MSKPRARKPAHQDRDVEPVFWFGFEVSWAKLLVFRVLAASTCQSSGTLQMS